MGATGTRVTRLLVAAVVAAIAAVACGAQGGTAGTAGGSPSIAVPVTPPTQAAPPTERPAFSYAGCDTAAATPIRLLVRDQESADGLGAVFEQLAAEFMAANPGVTVVREVRTPEELGRTIVADLGSVEGPDIAQVPQGLGGLGAAVGAGVVLPLDRAAADFAWAERWAPRTLARLTATGDGRRLGEGSLYGVPLTGELVGIWFNDEVGHSRPAFEPPQTLEQTIADFAAVKEAGVVPILAGGAEDGLVDLYGSILGSLVTPAWLDDVAYGREGATFDVPETQEAAALLVAMRDRGLLAEGFETLTSAEAYDRFVANEAQWLVGSSALLPVLGATEGTFRLGTLKPETAGGTLLPVGGTGMPFVIRRTSAYPDCAAAYLDFITGDHAMDLVMATNAHLPSHVPSLDAASDPWYRDLLFAYRDAESDNELGHDLSWAFPEASATLKDGLDRLMAGTITPETLVQEVDAAFQAYLQSAR